MAGAGQAKPVDRSWLERNLGLTFPERTDRESVGPPTGADDQAILREIIDFDSEGDEGRAFRTAAPKAYGLSEFVDITWPTGLRPTSGPKPTGSRLPRADVLIVTWTVDEGHALSRVLTPGVDSRDDWLPYTRNYAAIAATMRPGCPARNARRLGTYWTTTIGDKKVTLFKSDSHMSQDGPKLPNATVWRQIMDDVRPKLVITTGTGGGIGAAEEVGDVIVSRFVTFSCRRTFKRLDRKTYASSSDAPNGRFAQAAKLFGANDDFLPKDNTRPPQIVVSDSAATGILTTDYFGFDNTANTYGLQGNGDLSEMGDAVLGMICKRRRKTAPAYVIVRNVSDPQIDASSMTIREQEAFAAAIYKGFGRWSSVCSAIVCWAIVADLD